MRRALHRKYALSVPALIHPNVRSLNFKIESTPNVIFNFSQYFSFVNYFDFVMFGVAPLADCDEQGGIMTAANWQMIAQPSRTIQAPILGGRSPRMLSDNYLRDFVGVSVHG